MRKLEFADRKEPGQQDKNKSNQHAHGANGNNILKESKCNQNNAN